VARLADPTVLIHLDPPPMRGEGSRRRIDRADESRRHPVVRDVQRRQAQRRFERTVAARHELAPASQAEALRHVEARRIPDGVDERERSRGAAALAHVGESFERDLEIPTHRGDVRRRVRRERSPVDTPAGADERELNEASDPSHDDAGRLGGERFERRGLVRNARDITSGRKYVKRTHEISSAR
jgi:hypothetical protein